MNLTSIYDKRYLIAIIILSAAGIAIRAYSLGAQSIWLDEGTSGNLAKGLLRNGRPAFGGFESFKGILHTVFVTISFAALGVGEAAGRLPSVIFGTLSIPLGFLIGERMKNRRVGLIAAFLITFTTVQIAWSRQIRFYQQLQFFFLLLLYSTDRITEEVNWRNASLLMFAGLCTVLSHGRLGFLLLAPSGIWILTERARWIKQRIMNPGEIKTRNWIGLGILIAGGAVFMYLNSGTIESGISHVLNKERDYFFDYVDYFEGELGRFFLLAIPGSVLAFTHRRKNAFYSLAFLLPFLMLSYRVYAYQTRHVFSLIALLLILSAFSLEHVYEKAKNTLSPEGIKPVLGVVTASALVLLLTAYPTGSFTYTPEKYYDLGRTQPQGDFERAHEYIEKNWRENDVLVTTIPPVTIWYMPEDAYEPYYYLKAFWNFPMTEVIWDIQKMRAVENGNSGWVVVDAMGAHRIRRGGEWITSREALNYIEDNFDPVGEASGPGVRVYHWT